MKMFKRFAAALLAGVMVLAMLTACGGGAGGSSSNEIESKVLELLNTTSGTSFSNNAELQSKVRKALAQLQKIKDDGTIAVTDANTSIVTPNADGKSVTAVVISVGTKGEPDKGVCQAKEITAESLGEITTEGAGEDAVETMRALKKIGIATKVINGKTYAAIAIEIVQSVS